MKNIFFSIFFLLTSFWGFAQIAMSTENQSNRWTFGGGLGLGFGSNNYFSLQIAPRVGYMLTNQLEGGAVGSLSLQKDDYYNSSIFGVGPFINYYFARSFYIGANLQQYFISSEAKYYDQKRKANETALNLGGGYMQPLGGQSFAQFGIMYNVLWKENRSNFNSAFIPSLGFVVGL